MTLSLSQDQTSTGFFTKSPEHTATSVVDTRPTIPQDDELSDILQDDKTTPTGSDIHGVTEREVLKDDNLEDHSETKLPLSLSISENTNSEHERTNDIRSEPPLLEESIPVGDDSMIETTPYLSDDPETHTVVEESPVLSHNSDSNVVEKPSVELTNTEDHGSEETPTVEDADDYREDIVSPLSPSEDSLANVNYEKPEDEEEPDGIASMFRLQKESIKGEEMIQLQDMADSTDNCVVTLISRRSRYRAGQ